MARSGPPEPIAVVGVGCRLPGGVGGLESLGHQLLSGGDALSEVPADRWGPELHDAALSRPGTIACHVGGFLPDIDRFDAAYFGISPAEAAAMDPQQRLLLEVGWEAMSDAGRTREDWRGTRTGVFVGLLANDYVLLHAKSLGLAGIGPHYGTGTEASFVAARLAYAFDLHGPVAALSSACSSSLLAVHVAGQSLRAGDCDMAVVGGVSLLVAPDLSVFMSQVGAISRSGRCRPFDVGADGVVRGEGCGAVVLKRLSDAVADRDRVYATVVGSAVNNDGASMGLTAPSAVAQTAVLRAALADAAVGPHDVDYVEAHGTGTPLGDLVELRTLAEVYGTGRPAGRPLFVGSHKATFGHTDGAAGITGLLKATWMLSTGQVPPQPHVTELTPAVDWSRSGLAVHVEGSDGDGGGVGPPSRVGVSAFGLSGTNVHVIAERADQGRVGPEPGDDPPARPHVLLVSALRADGLVDQTALMRAEVVRAGAGDDLSDLVASAATRRTHEAHRGAIVAADREHLLAALERPESLPEGAYAGVAGPNAAPVFVFSGQGCQWPGMATDLYDHDPVVRQALDQCDALIRAEASPPWSLVDELRRVDDSRLGRTDIAQPAIFAVQLALTRWLAQRGVEPAAVVGHSVGEVAAAHVAGGLSLDDAIRLVVRRGQILHETAGAGGMTAVHGSPGLVQEILEESGLPVVLAAMNGPASVVVAGPTDALAAMVAVLERQGLRCRQLPLDYAFHSPAVADCGPRLGAAMAGLVAELPAVPLVSTVDPQRETVRLDADYWARNVTERVQLWPAVDRLLQSGEPVLVEIGPHPVLTRPLLDALRHRNREGTVVDMLRRDQPGAVALHRALARLHVVGVTVDWEQVTGRPRRYRTLPVPSWGGGRYWLPGVPRGHLSDRQRQAVGEAPPAARPPSAPPDAAVQPGDDRGSTGDQAGNAALADGSPGMPAPGIVERVDAVVRDALGLERDRPLARRRGLFEQGMDSLTAVEVRARLEAVFDVTLASTVVFEHPTIAKLAAHLADQGVGPAVASSAAVSRPGRRSGEGAVPIAVIGVGCRLPGASSPEQLWSLLERGANPVGDLPVDRLDDPMWAEAGHDVPTRGCYLDDVAGFDAELFRISPREARSLDPQQRLALEVAWETLEDGGYPAHCLEDRPVGVYLGLNTADYQQLLTRDMRNVDLYYGTGTTFAATAGRLSYFLGLTGPSLAVDTACSASLTAVHLACQGLRDGDCEMALVGGANVIVAPTVSVAMSAGAALAPDGICKTFDEAADGYGRGEGAVVFLLKPLAAAERDGDRVYAVLRGSAVNQDGASGGFTVPNPTAQVAVIRQALAQAGWAPGDVDYVEAHGTGTPLGDPIEVHAIGEALGRGRDPDRPVLLGSVKANLGHLEAAAGATGLLKVVLALHKGHLPPHLVKRPSSRIAWDHLPVALVTEARPWPDRSRPARAGVSAFGFSGSNAHVVVEQWPPSHPTTDGPDVPPSDAVGGAPVPWVITGRGPAALRGQAARLVELLRGDGERDPVDVGWSLVASRSVLENRAVVVGASRESLLKGVEAVERGDAAPGLITGTAPGGAGGVAFLFAGQDGQRVSVGRGLHQAYPVFARAWDEVCGILGDDDEAGLFAFEVALFRLLEHWGVHPDWLLGHAVGEIAAAHVAGVLSLEDACALIAARASEDELAEVVKHVQLHPPQVPLVSGVTGRPVTDEVCDPGYWVRQAQATVRFGDGVRHLLDAGVTSFVELGPDGQLAALATETINNPDREVVVLAALRKGRAEPECLLEAVGGLFVRGHGVDWAAVFEGREPQRVELPTYAFQHRRYWIEPPAGAARVGSVVDGWRYRVVWRPVDGVDGAGAGAVGGVWVVVVPAGLVGVGWVEGVVEALESRGVVARRVVVDVVGVDRAGLVEQLGGVEGVGGVVSLLGVDETPHGEFPVVAGGVAATLGLVQALGDVGFGGRLWCVTRGAVGVGSGDRVVSPGQGQVWGLGRVAGLELPGLWGGLVDLPAGDLDGVVLGRLCGVLAGGDEDQVAVRSSGVFVRRLVRAPRSGVGARSWRPEGTVLVTGGTGALGARVARWLAVNGAEHLVLTSRRGMEAPGADDLYDELTALGARVTIAACDITDRDALADLLAEHPLTAVVHAASSSDTGLLSETTVGRYAAAVAAKVQGARHLDELLDRESLEALVLFSSVSGVWGGRGEGAYAAANAFLDGLAEWRRGRGLAGSSVAWGAWGGGGLASTAGGVERLRLRGVRAMAPELALGALQQVLDDDEPTPVVADVDWERFAPLYSSARPRPLLDEIVELPEAAEGGGDEASAVLARRVAGLPPVERERVLLDVVRAEVAGVLGHDTPDGVTPDRAFRDLGFDSLTAVELRDRLVATTGLRLPPSLVFDYPTPTAIARHLHAHLTPQPHQDDDAELQRAIASIPLERLRQAGVLDTLRRLAGITADAPHDDSTDVGSLATMDVADLVHMALEETGDQSNPRSDHDGD